MLSAQPASRLSAFTLDEALETLERLEVLHEEVATRQYRSTPEADKAGLIREFIKDRLDDALANQMLTISALAKVSVTEFRAFLKDIKHIEASDAVNWNWYQESRAKANTSKKEGRAAKTPNLEK